MHPVLLTYTNCLFIRHNTTTLKISFTLTVYQINKLVIHSWCERDFKSCCVVMDKQTISAVIFPHRLKLSFCESQKYLFPFKTLDNSAVEMFITSGNFVKFMYFGWIQEVPVYIYYNSTAPYSYSPPHQYAINRRKNSASSPFTSQLSIFMKKDSCPNINSS
jgi:hypothetical protein